MMANQGLDESASIESAELLELGDVSERTRGAFRGYIEEPSLMSWRTL